MREEQAPKTVRLETTFAARLQPHSSIRPVDVYCTLSVRLMELCALVVASVAVTTTV